MSELVNVERRVAVNGIFNLRDLGGYQTPDGLVAWRRLFRADGLHRVKGIDLEGLRPLGLRTVIDLRTNAELSEHGSLSCAELGAWYHHIPIIAKSWDASAYSSVTDAAQFLADRYVDMLLEGGIAIAHALEILARSTAYPVAFHCAAGKDRTGVLAAVVLSLLGVDATAIADDYALSAAAVQEMLRWLSTRSSEAGQAMTAQPRAFLEAPPAAIAGLLDWVRREYGSMEVYVSYLGVDASVIDALRDNLLA